MVAGEFYPASPGRAEKFELSPPGGGSDPSGPFPKSPASSPTENQSEGTRKKADKQLSSFFGMIRPLLAGDSRGLQQCEVTLPTGHLRYLSSNGGCHERIPADGTRRQADQAVRADRARSGTRGAGRSRRGAARFRGPLAEVSTGGARRGFPPGEPHGPCYPPGRTCS